jgi:hypothetical protein
MNFWDCPSNLYSCKSFGRLNHVLSWLAVVRSVFVLSVKLSWDCSVTESPTWNCFHRSTLAFITVLSFLLGALCSGVAGYIGMWVSVRANVRVSSAARRSAREALLVCILDHFYFWEHIYGIWAAGLVTTAYRTYIPLHHIMFGMSFLFNFQAVMIWTCFLLLLLFLSFDALEMW